MCDNKEKFGMTDETVENFSIKESFSYISAISLCSASCICLIIILIILFKFKNLIG